MISTASSIATPVVTNALQGVDWSLLMMLMVPIAYAVILAIAFIIPVSRAFLKCLWASFGTFPLSRMYIESNKAKGKWFSRVSCIALIDYENNITKLFYGKPELLTMFNIRKEKQNG